MSPVSITHDDFLRDREGSTFPDVVNDPEQPFDAVLDFFNDEDRQRRMEGSEIHHERARLVEVAWELEAQPLIDDFLSSQNPLLANRLREAVGVVVRMVVERLGRETIGGCLSFRSKTMNTFRVWIRPLYNVCRVRVDGIDNAMWLLTRLSQSFVFKSSEPIKDDEGGCGSTFHVPYNSQMSSFQFERLLAGMPQVQLMADPA